MADAHAGEEFGEAAIFGGFDGGEEILNFLLAHAIEFEECFVVIFEGEDISEVVERDVGGADDVDG